MMHHFRFITLLVLLSFILGTPGFGREDLSGSRAPELAGILDRIERQATLKDLLIYAYAVNPKVEASRQSWQVFIENYRINTSYPDPQLAATYYPSPIETRLGPQDWNLTLSQAIPFPGTLGQKGKVLEADVSAAKLKVDKTVKMLVRDVSVAFYELVYVRRAIELAKANLMLNQRLLQMAENRYAADQGLLYDLSRARAQTAQIQYDITLLEELAQAETAKINGLLDRAPDATIGQLTPLMTRDPAYALNEVYDLAMAHQEDILMADLAFEQSKEKIRLARLENLPMFRLGLFYAGIGRPDVANPPPNAGDDAVGIQAGFNLPIWFGTNKSRVAKELALKEKARAERTDQANMIKSEISRVWFKLENARRLVSLYEKELLPQAMDQADAAQIWAEQGKGSLSDFLEIQATAYNFELALERARADYGQTLVRLEQLAGVILDQRLAPEKKETPSDRTVGKQG